VVYSLSENTTISIKTLDELFKREVEEVSDNYIPILLKLLSKCSPVELPAWIEKSKILLDEETPLIERYTIATSIREKVYQLVESNCID
jgi:hypothetical protein